MLTDLDSYTPTRLPTIAARPSLEETRSYERERTQRSPALRLPSLRHLIHTNPPNPSSNNFSSGEYDGPRVTTDGSIATPGTAHQHSSHFIPASLQRNPTNTAYGSPPGQNLQYACQLGVPPNPQEGERNPQSNNPSAAEYTNLGSGSGPAAGTGNYVPWFPESDDAFDAQAHAPAQAPGLSPDAGFGASTGNYIPWFPESDDMSGAKASDVNLDAGFGANTNNYVPWFAESEGMSGAEAPSVNPDAGLMAGNGNYVPWVPDIENGLAYHMR